VDIEQVDLDRYELLGVLGAGADYDVRAAVDQKTGRQVVLKRPKPQMISRRLHDGIEARTNNTLQVFQALDFDIPTVVPVLGCTRQANHDAYFGESLGQEYTVVVEERAKGIPLVGDPMARITGVPIGVGQNLFTLYPLVQPKDQPPFPIHQQLLDLEESFYQVGYVLLDLRPQNIFYQPAAGRITVIDCGDLRSLEKGSQSGRRPPPDIHDFYLEMLKFYTAPQGPPAEADGYRDPYGLRPVIRFEQELDEMARRFSDAAPSRRDTSLPMIGKVRERAYTCFDEFRRDLTGYLKAASEHDLGLANAPQLRQTWMEALGWLGDEYWRRYLFDYDTELTAFGI
jgi:hypothetical protein